MCGGEGYTPCYISEWEVGEERTARPVQEPGADGFVETGEMGVGF